MRQDPRTVETQKLPVIKVSAIDLDDTTPPPTRAQKSSQPLTRNWLKPTKTTIGVSLSFIGSCAVVGASFYHSTITDQLNNLKAETKALQESNISRDNRIQKVEIDSSYLRQSTDRIEGLVRDLNSKLDIALRDKGRP